MTTLATRRLIIQACDANYQPMLRLTYDRHSTYAAANGIDFWVCVGRHAQGLPPSWDKVVLLRRALDLGYEEVAWLDADTLIVDATLDIFPALPQRSCVAMAQFDNHIIYGEPHFNAGVLFARNGRAARRFFDWVWRHRARQRPEYLPSFWEQNQVLEYASRHREVFEVIDHRYNFIDGLSDPSIAPIIKGYHGQGLACVPAIERDLASTARTG